MVHLACVFELDETGLDWTVQDSVGHKIGQKLFHVDASDVVLSS